MGMKPYPIAHGKVLSHDTTLQPPDKQGYWLFERYSSGGGYSVHFVCVDKDRMYLIDSDQSDLDWERVRRRFTRWVYLDCELLIDGDIDARLKRLAHQEAVMNFVSQVEKACKQIRKDIPKA